MAFKSFDQYQEDKNGDFFVLPNDGDYADVVFLYRSTKDVLIADVHYINTATYKGYVHCCGAGCPACTHGENGIRVQQKMFIPLYNCTKKKIEFWDRTPFFEQVLQTSVFKGFPDPSVCIFRITRHGMAGSRDTKYEIIAKFKNPMTYEQILANNNITLPEGYSRICKEMSAAELSQALNAPASVDGLADYSYTPVPRGTAAPELEPINVPTPTYSEPPAVMPPLADAPSDLAEMPEYNPASVPATPIDAATEEGSGDDLDDVAF